MSKKRGNGEGSIYRRKDGCWVGQYTIYTATGPKYRYLYGKTRAAVAEKLTKAMADRNGGRSTLNGMGAPAAAAEASAARICRRTDSGLTWLRLGCEYV